MIMVAVLKISTKWGGVYSNIRGLVEFKWFFSFVLVLIDMYDSMFNVYIFVK